MLRTAHYLTGLLMLCLAFVFTMGLGSFLQHAAVLRQQQEQQAEANTPIEMPLVSMLPSGYRKASF
jgi:hypothetical protein